MLESKKLIKKRYEKFNTNSKGGNKTESKKKKIKNEVKCDKDRKRER